jgi:hypothetical protein
MRKLLLLIALGLTAAVPPVATASGSLSQMRRRSSDLGPRETTTRFVTAVNRADFRTACGLYSRRYLKATQAQCRALYARGFELYGPYRYRVLAARTLATHHYRASISRRGRAAGYLEFAREPTGWKLIHGGW